MKTLFVVYTYLGGHGGGVYAERAHVNLFAALSEKMTILYPYKEGEKLKGVNTEGVELIPVEDKRSKLHKLIDLLFGKVHRYKLNDYFFDKDRFDTVVFDNSVVSSRLIRRFNRAGIKTITIHHNYQIQYLLGDGSRLTLLPNLFWTWIYEGQAVRNSELNITLTSQDADLLKKHYGGKMPFAVLGVFEYQPCKPTEIPNESRQHRYVITGGLGSKQTEDSLLKWLDSYYPILMSVDPDAKLTIAGSNPSAKLSDAILSKGIELIASPTDMDPILQNADYYINPVDCGGGLKLRNMDGLKYGLPVLTHKVSLRGYEKMETLGLVLSYGNIREFTAGLKKMKQINYSKREIHQKYQEQYNFTNGVLHMKDILTKHGLI